MVAAGPSRLDRRQGAVDDRPMWFVFAANPDALNVTWTIYRSIAIADREPADSPRLTVAEKEPDVEKTLET